MISSDTPSKLVEIIHDTWPNLYRPMKELTNSTESPIMPKQFLNEHD
jgi:hypothetical protein